MSTSINWEFKSIPIDFEVYKALTANLESASDTFNDVIRRKFGLKNRIISEASSSLNIDNSRDWVCDGVRFPAGTVFRVVYKGQEVTARVQDGGLVFEGEDEEKKDKYFTPSAAAYYVTRTNVNGWRFWECRFPNQKEWAKIDRLRN